MRKFLAIWRDRRCPVPNFRDDTEAISPHRRFPRTAHGVLLVLCHSGPVCIFIFGRGGRPINERQPLNRFSFAKARQGKFQRHEGDIQSVVFDSCLLYSVEFNCEFEPQLTATQPTATRLFLTLSRLNYCQSLPVGLMLARLSFSSFDS